ncbi:polysaccharide deacetylase [Thiohalobacter sp. COW1]|uniref:Xylanase/chitin deacetylase n=1 Tax=Thiohalobacter thiocyanaticus TaxID=585455 RepID=A0A1Z4VST6_9GAMM|nr:MULTISPECIES: XrtA system polysaccharide deacetylase [Thiohalobacter]BAZ94701.1 xylanase/chitin deacetylase [Thiohalobacter thiocyanaticus]BCO30231.1 polysaccharide deacetylase [Thiohalobacter sp. COW1]
MSTVRSACANAMTVDVEDYFQVSAFEPFIRRDDWEQLPRRVERNTARILDLFGRAGVRATFFTLGWVAERHPQLIRRMVAEGHEVASHGFQHTRVTQQGPEDFRADVRRTKALLEDIAGVPVTGYRAASYSIGRDNLWALAVLEEEGYRYSSSIYPINHDLYGMPEAPRFAFRVNGGDFVEVPVTTLRLGARNLPCGGGGYFRLLPYRISRWAMRRVNQDDGQPCVFYFHPWEIDPDQPRQPGLNARTRFRHYLNLRRMEARLQRLLTDFAWQRMDETFTPAARFPAWNAP